MSYSDSSNSPSPRLRPIQPPSLNSWMQHQQPQHQQPQQAYPTQPPLIRQPTGFSYNPPQVASGSLYSAPAPMPANQLHPSSRYPQPGEFVHFDQPKEKKKRSKDKDKEKDRSRSKAQREHHHEPPPPAPSHRSSDKGKSRTQSHYPSHTVYDAPTPSANSAEPSGAPAFQVDNYVNDHSPPGPGVAPSVPGPYNATYRVPGMVAPRVTRPKKMKYQWPRQESQPDPGMAEHQERLQEHLKRSKEHPPEATPTPPPPDMRQAPPPDEYYAESPGPSVSEVAMQSQSNRRHHKFRTRHEDAHGPHHSQESHIYPHSQAPSQSYSHTSSSRTKQPSRPPPVLRILTLLIEDMRVNPPDNLLTEVRVPLRDTGVPDGGYWADAKEVVDELQVGPSRIDGPAKVYTKRGKFKQYFLRVTSEGGNDCTPANLKVAADRTLEVFVETAPSNTAGIQAASLMHFQMHTPVTDPPSPPPHHIAAPQPVAPFSVDGFSQSRYDFDETVRPRSAVPRKRQHSVSSRQSSSVSRDTRSHDYLAPPDDPSIASQNSPSTELSSNSRITHSSESLSTASGQRTASTSHSIVSFGSQASPIEQTSSVPITSPSSPRSSIPLQQQPPPPVHDPPSFQSPSPPPPIEQSSFSPVQKSPNPPPPSQSFPPPIIAASHKAVVSPPVQTAFFPHNTTPSPTASLSLPSPSAAKKLKLSHTSEETPPATDKTPTPRIASATPSATAPAPSWGAFGSTTAFSPTTGTPFGSAPSSASSSGFGAPSTPSAFGSASFGSSNAFAKPMGFGASAFQPTVSRMSMNTNATPTSATPTSPSTPITPTFAPTPEIDNTVGQYLRSIFSKEPGWAEFVASRSKPITVAELIRAQYTYVQGKMDRYVGTKVPIEAGSAAGVVITKAQVLKAFNMKPEWGEECTDTLSLTVLYGPGGKRYEDPQALQMVNEMPPVTIGMQVKKYLTLLREIHARFGAEHPGM